MQHMPPPPAEGRLRRNVLCLPVINPDRLRTAKALVEKAVKLRKVFSVQGPYPVIRAALRSRGWVERRLPRPSQRAPSCHDEEDGDDGDESNDVIDLMEERQKEEDSDDICDLMSRLVRNETTYFYWTRCRDSIDCRTLRKDQMTNHYANAGTFTTKVGLCLNLRNLRWFDTADPDTFFPRCYRLGAEDEKHAFIEDFRRTTCTSLLQYVVQTASWREEEPTSKDNVSVESEGNKCQRRQRRRSERRFVGPEMIDRALRICQEFLNSLDHSDIDITMDTPPSLTEEQWAQLLQDYYLVVHEGVLMEGAGVFVERCQAMLTRLQEVCPQLDTDGLHNIWIIKPGAKSRGRGIKCMNRLDEILALVDSDTSMIKDSKWVVQKYLERPLLVHDTKFDLRQWFLVTDWNPLTIWFYRECYLRFSTQPYSTKTLDSSVHLCNNSIQKHFQPSQRRHPGVPEHNMWTCSEFRAFLRGLGRGADWGTVVVPGMQRAVIHAMQTAQDLVESRKASFELYGADFMLGRDLRPWLLEINASPTMACSTAVTARLCPAVQLDTLRVVLDRRVDPSAYTGGFQLIYKQAAVEVPQYVGVNLLVEGAKIKRHRSPQQRQAVMPVPPLTSQQSSQHSPAERAVGTTKPSNHRPSAAPAPHPSGKENQSDGVKKQRLPSATVSPKQESEGKSTSLQSISSASKSCRRLAPELSVAEPQKRARRLGISFSSGGTLLVSRAYSLSPPYGTSGFKPQPDLGKALQRSRTLLPRTATEPQCRPPPPVRPSFHSCLPAVEGFSLRPSSLTGPQDSPSLSLPSQPSLRRHEALPHFNSRTVIKYQGGSPDKLKNC